MVLAFGALMMVLGLLAGLVLTLAALGLIGTQPNWSALLAYPALTLLGLALLAIPAKLALVKQISRGAGTVCMGLAMLCLVVLCLQMLGIYARTVAGGTLWWVLACSVLLGPLAWMAAKAPTEGAPNA